MAAPRPLQQTFSRGINRDIAREQLPVGFAWDLVDYVPDDLDAPLRERKGYTYASDDLAETANTATSVIAGIHAPFSAGTQSVVLDQLGELYSVAPSVSDIDTAAVTEQNPVFHRDQVIIPTSSGAFQYDGSSVTAISGSPEARFACVYKDRTVLAADATNRERVWFSAAGDPLTYDTTTSWVDSSYPLNGIAALRSSILLFSDGTTERLRGTTPPPDDDFELDVLVTQGCTDARSIVIFGDFAIWANPSGVWMSDGAASIDLTYECGAKTWWRAQLSGYAKDSWTLAAGFLGNCYVIAILADGTFVDCLSFDVPKRRWWRYSNIDALTFWRSSGSEEELFFGRSGAARVGGLAAINQASSSYNQDADGTYVLAKYESPFFEGRARIKRWRDLYLQYDLRDAEALGAGYLVSYIDSPEQTLYTTVAPTIAPSTYIERRRVHLGIGRYGLGFKVERINPASDARIYALEADFAEIEGQRLYNRAGVATRAPAVPAVGSRAFGSVPFGGSNRDS